MSQNAFDSCIIRSCVVQHRCAGMAAFVWRMVAGCGCHDLVKQPPVGVVGELASLVISYERTSVLLHPQLKIRERLAAYRYSPIAASLSLAVTDDKVTLLELDVTFLDGQKFARPHAAVTHHHNTHRPARQRIVTIG